MQQPGKTRLTQRVDPWPGRPGRTRTRPDVFFPFSNVVFCPSISLLISSSSVQWVVVSSSREERRERDVVVGGWSKERLVRLVCQWAAALVWQRDGGGWGRRKRGSLVLAKKPGGWLRKGCEKLWPGCSFHAAWRNAFYNESEERREENVFYLPIFDS